MPTVVYGPALYRVAITNHVSFRVFVRPIVFGLEINAANARRSCSSDEINVPLRLRAKVVFFDEIYDPLYSFDEIYDPLYSLTR